MKKAAIAFVIVGIIMTIVIGIYQIVTGPQAYANTYYEQFGKDLTDSQYASVVVTYSVMGSLSIIFALLFGGLALFDLFKNKKRTWVGVCALLFCGLLGGILYLCYKPSEIYIRPHQHTEPKVADFNDDSDYYKNRFDDEMKKMELLEKYKEMHDKGILTDAEYEEKKNELLN